MDILTVVNWVVKQGFENNVQKSHQPALFFTLVHVYQQNLWNLFSYFTTLRISMTMLHMYYYTIYIVIHITSQPAILICIVRIFNTCSYQNHPSVREWHVTWGWVVVLPQWITTNTSLNEYTIAYLVTYPPLQHLPQQYQNSCFLLCCCGRCCKGG